MARLALLLPYVTLDIYLRQGGLARSALVVGVTARRGPVARPLLRRLWRTNAALTVTGGLMVATLAATLVGLVVDPRVITGAPAWLKPTKFAISTAVYSFTLVWLLGFVRGHQRLVAPVGNA